MIKFSVLKYCIIYSLMAQTTLAAAVQTVERVNVSGQVDSPVCGVHALSMYRILQLEGSGGILPWEFLENGYHKIESRSYF